ncbi:hypothetical protein DV737_g2296, partial [Chaetothyriales sp. CBS 132003]
MVMAPSAIVNINESPVFHEKINLIRDHYGDDKADATGLASKSLIQKVLKEHIAQINVDTCEPGEEDAFYVADLGEVYRQHLRWKMNLGRVKPFYAVKCNPDTEVLRLLGKLGTGFDCASKAEIDLVLGLGIAPCRIIYAQPCKTKSYLRHARAVGVRMMTFDNSDELLKIKDCYPEAELVLRILTDDSASLCRLSAKYGASLADAIDLLRMARDLNLNLVGLSFHVGSGASDPRAFRTSVAEARAVFDEAEALGFALNILDVGGGFVDETFEMFAATLNQALEDYFPGDVRIIGEPGRYYASNAFTLATNVIARRQVRDPASHEEAAYMLYLNDGIYGNFSNIIFDHQHPVPQVLYTASETEKMTEYSVWGPTCDGIDVITDCHFLPAELNVGDWLFFENMGAYTKCSATRFNGFTDNHQVIYISSEPGASELLGYSS